jgi:hypothetical protein
MTDIKKYSQTVPGDRIDTSSIAKTNSPTKASPAPQQKAEAASQKTDSFSIQQLSTLVTPALVGKMGALFGKPDLSTITSKKTSDSEMSAYDATDAQIKTLLKAMDLGVSQMFGRSVAVVRENTEVTLRSLSEKAGNDVVKNITKDLAELVFKIKT